MANLNDKQSQSRLMLPVVLVGPELRISDQLNEENRWLLFDRAWNFLAPAVERDGEHTKSSVLAALRRDTFHRQSGVALATEDLAGRRKHAVPDPCPSGYLRPGCYARHRNRYAT